MDQIVFILFLIAVSVPKIGKLKGLKDDSGAGIFDGIPFSLPPVGNYRWRKPRPIRRINTKEEYYDATHTRPACPQYCEIGRQSCLNLRTSEDCLYAEINLPGKLLEKKKAGQSYHYTLKSNARNAKLPVMVFFYGGAFRFGGSYEYHPKYIAERGNVIVVIPNYRLGLFGFFYQNSGDSDAALGNYGMWDQIESLRWVRDVIDGFGGDPNQVTIFGESAGGQSVGIHLVNKHSDPLFKNAIMQSNPISIYFQTPLEAQMFNNRFVHWMKNSNQNNKCRVNDMKCLRSISMEDLMAHYQSFPRTCQLPRALGFNFTQIFKITTLLEPWAPIIDNDILSEQPLITFTKGRNQKKPVIFGYTKNEVLTFVAAAKDILASNTASSDNSVLSYLISQPEFTSIVEDFATSLSNADSLMDWVIRSADKILTNQLLLCPGRRAFNSDKASYGNSNLPVWWYSFDASPTNSSFWAFKGCAGEACHTAELPFLFEERHWLLTDDEIDLAHKMIYYWTNFAKSGNPNKPLQGSLSAPQDGANGATYPPTVSYWPRMYEGSTASAVVYKTMVMRTKAKGGLAVIKNFEKTQCDLTDKHAAFKSKATPEIELPVDDRCTDKTKCKSKNRWLCLFSGVLFSG